jgi:hypothetical protein
MRLMSRSTGHIKTRDNQKINNADAGSGMGRFGPPPEPITSLSGQAVASPFCSFCSEVRTDGRHPFIASGGLGCFQSPITTVL